MKKQAVARITIVSFIVGLMIAVQYNTVQQPTERDTRDIWEIRQELSEEKKRHSELLSEIQTINETIEKYEDSNTDSSGQALRETVEKLKQQAGLLPVTGPGVTLNISPATELIQFGYEIKPISPNLLIRLVNEIYRFNGLYIEIDGQRVVSRTAIRDINGVTTVNSIPLNDPNVEIRIVTETFEKAEKLYSYLYASSFRDDFYLDNLNLKINEAQTNVTIAAYDGKLSHDYLFEKEKGE